jgi:copper transport protein
VLRTTSAVAGITFIVSLVTGLLLANDLVPSIAGLTGSVYGWGLIAKSLLAIPVLILALLIRSRLKGGRAGSVWAEALLLLSIVVIAVFVASTPPPASARFQPTPSWSGDTAPVAVGADDLLVSFQIDPNTPGTRFVVVRVDNTRKPAPAPVTGVSVDVGTGVPIALVKGKDNLWTGGVEVTDPGPTDVSVSVTRPGFPVAIANTSWVVSPTPGTLDGGPSLTGLVTVLIVGLVAAWLLVLLIEGWRSSRRKVEPEPEEVTVG